MGQHPPATLFLQVRRESIGVDDVSVVDHSHTERKINHEGLNLAHITASRSTVAIMCDGVISGERCHVFARKNRLNKANVLDHVDAHLVIAKDACSVLASMLEGRER